MTILLTYLSSLCVIVYSLQLELWNSVIHPDDLLMLTPCFIIIKSPLYEPSSFKLSKMQTCILMSSHLSQFTYLVKFSRYCNFILFSLFLYLSFMYYLSEKYCKPITVQYYIIDCLVGQS